LDNERRRDRQLTVLAHDAQIPVLAHQRHPRRLGLAAEAAEAVLEQDAVAIAARSQVDDVVELVHHLGVEVGAHGAGFDEVAGPADEQHARPAPVGVLLGRADAVPRHTRAQVRVVGREVAGGGEAVVETLCWEERVSACFVGVCGKGWGMANDLLGMEKFLPALFRSKKTNLAALNACPFSGAGGLMCVA
jgi:hypothetical protein